MLIVAILHFYAEYYYPVYNRGTIHTLWKLACNNSYDCKWFILFAPGVNVIKLFSSSLKLRLKKLVCLPLAIILNNKKKKTFLLFAIIQVELARVFVRGNHFEPSPTLANAGAYQSGALLKGLGF
jgi:hypothetical protein